MFRLERYPRNGYTISIQRHLLRSANGLRHKLRLLKWVDSVPHIGWNGVTFHQSPEGLGIESVSENDWFTGRRWYFLTSQGSKVYFVHSYRACPSVSSNSRVAPISSPSSVQEHNAAWVLATTDYAGFPYISAVR
jgi:imidazoleglycerol phosphate synthase glutamine amidotransferase subunit HisH